MKWEYHPKTDYTLSAIETIAQHWVDTENLIEQDANLEYKKCKAEADTAKYDDLSELSSDLQQSREMHDSVYIPMHRNSCIVMLYSTVEHELRKLVANLEKEKGAQVIKLSHLHGALLEKTDIYISAFHGIKISECPFYESLCDLQLIRDCIVHCLGDISLSKDKLRLTQVIKKRKGLFDYPHGEIRIEPELIMVLIEDMWDLFSWVFKKLDWKISTVYQNKLRFDRAKEKMPKPRDY